jgi:hypothetical protein
VGRIIFPFVGLSEFRRTQMSAHRKSKWRFSGDWAAGCYGCRWQLGQEPKGVKYPAIDGLIKEGDEVAGDVADKEVLDAAIIGSAQAVEHYEIARYGTLIAWAEAIGHSFIWNRFFKVTFTSDGTVFSLW